MWLRHNPPAPQRYAGPKLIRSHCGPVQPWSQAQFPAGSVHRPAMLQSVSLVQCGAATVAWATTSSAAIRGDSIVPVCEKHYPAFACRLHSESKTR